MYNLTQTTENQSSRGRVCPTTTSLDKPGYVDTLVQQVSCLDRAPTHEATVSKRNTSLPCSCEGAGQRACTVPTSTPTTVIRISSSDIFSHRGEKTEMCSRVADLTIPWNGTGLLARSVKKATNTRRTLSHRYKTEYPFATGTPESITVTRIAHPGRFLVRQRPPGGEAHASPKTPLFSRRIILRQY
jgi:hypothetical protein